MKQLRIGTRGSALALVQARLAETALRDAFPDVETEIVPLVTSGDRGFDTEAARRAPAGVKGLFTREIEAALLRGEVDVAVHSCKDLPGELPEGLLLAAALERAPVDDLLITRMPPAALGTIPDGAVIGTGSIRRTRQLLWQRPGLRVVPIRGNVPTRLTRLREEKELAGIVLARAGLERLGYPLKLDDTLESAFGLFHAAVLDFYPAIGQGAIVLQTRAEDVGRLAGVNHGPTWRAIRAERELMRLLQGDCHLPVGVRTTQADGRLRLEALLFDEPGREGPVKGVAEGPDDAPEAVARAVAAKLRG